MKIRRALRALWCVEEKEEVFPVSTANDDGWWRRIAPALLTDDDYQRILRHFFLLEKAVFLEEPDSIERQLLEKELEGVLHLIRRRDAIRPGLIIQELV